MQSVGPRKQSEDPPAISQTAPVIWLPPDHFLIWQATSEDERRAVSVMRAQLAEDCKGCV